jgi:Ca2+-binding RTX toxin-like protein
MFRSRWRRWLNLTVRPSPPIHRSRPAVETLEDRCLLSADFSLVKTALPTLLQGLHYDVAATFPAVTFPFVGDLDKDAVSGAKFLDELHNDVTSDAWKQTVLTNADDVKTALTKFLDAKLVQPNTSDPNDVKFKVQVEQDTTLGTTFQVHPASPIANLLTSSDQPGLWKRATVTVHHTFDLQFSVSSTHVSLNATPDPVMRSQADVTLHDLAPDAELNGLGSVPVALTESGASKYSVVFDYAVTNDLVVPTSGALSADDVPSTITLDTDASHAGVHLGVSLDTGTDFLGTGAELQVQWGFANDFSAGEFHATGATVAFAHVQLDASAVLSNFIEPILHEVKAVLAPLKPVHDILYTPLPIFSDLLSHDVTLIGILEVLEKLPGLTDDQKHAFADFTSFLDTFDKVDQLVTELDTLEQTIAGKHVAITIGSFELKTNPKDPTTDPLNTAFHLNPTNFTGPSTTSLPNEVSTFFTDLKDLGGVNLPILDTPMTGFSLLLGAGWADGSDPISLFTYSPPTVNATLFDYHQFIPIIGPLGAEIGGQIAAHLHLAFGFDTAGLEEGDPTDGFYLDAGSYFALTGNFDAAAAAELLVFDVEVGGGLVATLSFSPHDPSNDGKSRFNELEDAAQNDPLCILEAHGELSISLSGDVKIGVDTPFGFLGVEYSQEFASIPLVSFDQDCDQHTDAEDFPAYDDPASGILYLEPQKAESLNTSSDPAQFEVDHNARTAPDALTVTVLGKRRTFAGVTKIETGEVDDAGNVIDHDNQYAGDVTVKIGKSVTAPAVLVLGDGNNALTYLGSGAAFMTVGTGNNKLTGGKGTNTFTVQGNGNNVLAGGTGGNLFNVIGDGDNVLSGSGSDTFTVTGGGNNTLTGGSGASFLIVIGTGTNRLTGGSGDNHLLVNGDGDSTLIAGSGAGTTNDLRVRGEGAHTFFAGPGSNTITSTGTSDNSVNWLAGDGDTTITINNDPTGQNALQMGGWAGGDGFDLAPNDSGVIVTYTPGDPPPPPPDSNLPELPAPVKATVTFNGVVQKVSIDGNAGGDTTTVHDLGDTGVLFVGVNLGVPRPPGQPPRDDGADLTVVEGSPGNLRRDVTIGSETVGIGALDEKHHYKQIVGVARVQTFRDGYQVYVGAVNGEDELDVNLTGKNNRVEVQSTLCHTVVTADQGRDVFGVTGGETPAEAVFFDYGTDPKHYHPGLYGQLDIHAGASANHLTADAEGQTVPIDATLTSGQITGTVGQNPLDPFTAKAFTINYDTTGSIDVKLTTGTANDSVTAQNIDVGTTINTGSGDDTVTTQAVSLHRPLTVNGDDGNDTFDIGNANNSLDDILGMVTFDGGNGSNILRIDDQGASAAESYTLTAGKLNRSGAGTINFSNLGPEPDGPAGTPNLTINAGAHGNVVTVKGTPGPYTVTWLNSGTGNDQVNVLATLGVLVIDGDAGADRVLLGSSAPSPTASPVLGGTVFGHIRGFVNLFNDHGPTDLLIDDSGDTVARTGTVVATELQGLSAGIHWQPGQVRSVTVFGGTPSQTGSGNVFNVTSLMPTGQPITLFTGNGDDTVKVTVNDFYPFLLHVHGQGGHDRLILNDQANANPFNYTITSTSVTRANAVVWTYASLEIGYDGIEDLSVTGGSSDDHFDVQATATGCPVALDGAGGSDTLTGPDAASTWKITSADAGTLTGLALPSRVTWSHVENLAGGRGADQFVFDVNVRFTGSVSGTIDGGGGIDGLDYSQFTAGVAVNLTTGTATNSGGVKNVENVTGGAGADLLVGNALANVLQGNAGQDVLIGGAGQDVLHGGAGDDLLIGGTTSYDANEAALLAILAEWRRVDESVGTRVANLRHGIADGSIKLGSTTVFDDGVKDVLTGGAGTDWFWASLLDSTDRQQGLRTSEPLN